MRILLLHFFCYKKMLIISMSGAGLCFALLSGCSDDALSGASPYPNIIFLTVDTLRPDHMGLYGYGRNTMPEIKAFAKTGVVFDNAVVPRGSTRPSYASMLTGLYPYRHGVHSNRIKLHEDVLTLPEKLRRVGYHTAAFVSNFVLVKELSGLAQGFDIYDDFVDEKEPNRNFYERTGSHTLGAILKWLDSIPSEPFFLFTNFMDPHGPYRPPENYKKMFQSMKQRELPEDVIPPYQMYENSFNYYDYIDRYDGELRFTDAVLGVLIAELKSRGLWDNSIIVFTADHGESFGEHDLYFQHHLHLWEETIRVPLVLRFPELFNPKRSSELCSPMDLPATLYDYLKINTEIKLDGESLLPKLSNRLDKERAFLIEAPRIEKEGTLGAFAIRTATHKLIQVQDMRKRTPVSLNFFNVSKDPLEKNKIIFDENVSIHRDLQEKLNEELSRLWEYELPFTPLRYDVPDERRKDFINDRLKKTESRGLTPTQIQKLQSLGYLR